MFAIFATKPAIISPFFLTATEVPKYGIFDKKLLLPSRGSIINVISFLLSINPHSSLKIFPKSFKFFINISSRKISILKDESIDFILNHPPYADIIKYSEKQIDEDLSNIHDLEKFCDEYEKVIKELYRVLKPNKYCAILIGDTRRNKMYQPLAFMVMQRFLQNGFTLKEDIIKHQHNCKATGFWVNRSKEANFLLMTFCLLMLEQLAK